MADRAQAAHARWWPYAGVGPVGQAITAMTTPRTPQLAYLLRPRRVSPRPFARTERSASAVAEKAAPSPSSLAAAKMLPPASSKLRRDLLYLLHLLAEPFESR